MKNFKYRPKFCVILVMGLISILSSMSIVTFCKKVHLVCDAVDVTFDSPFQETEKILNHVNLKLDKDDTLLRNDENDIINITVTRGFYVTVKVGCTDYKVKISGGTVKDVIEKLNLSIDPTALIIPPPDTDLCHETSVQIVNRKKILLQVDGQNKDVLVPEGTLKSALDFICVDINEYDKVNHDLNAKVYEDMRVKIDRVLYVYVTTVHPIPFKTVYKDVNCDNIITPGATGREDVTSRQKIVNGDIVESTEINRVIVEEPINEIRGEQKSRKNFKSNDTPHVQRRPSSESAGILTDLNGNKISYSKKIVGECTAYTARKDSLTSTGVVAQVGRVAVNPKIIPYGTKLYICSEDFSIVYGYATASDTGGALLSGRVLVDLFYNTESECINFGRRNMAVYILS